MVGTKQQKLSRMPNSDVQDQISTFCNRNNSTKVSDKSKYVYCFIHFKISQVGILNCMYIFFSHKCLIRIPIKCPDGCSTEIMWPEFENHKKYCGQLIYTCNSCIQITKKCYHCTICENFDLCMKCYSRYGHPHKMTKNAFNYGRITRYTF